MTPDAIAELLVPFLGGERLSATQLEQLAVYLDLLVRWNARTNLTAVRDPEHIVSRHYGESLFAARHLLPSGERPPDGWPTLSPSFGEGWGTTGNCADLGSGAGFPGLPLKIWAPCVHITLIESHNKKATFLREVIRALQLKDAEVFSGRGEDLANALSRSRLSQAGSPTLSPAVGKAGWPTLSPAVGEGWGNRFDLVTMRGVERFESALNVAGRLLASGGRLALLIGSAQVDSARNHLRHLHWSEPLAVPLSAARVLLVGTNPPRQEPQE